MEKQNGKLFKITATINPFLGSGIKLEPWDGFVVLYDNGFFEGIPYTDDKRNKQENLIFGFFLQDKIIDVFQINRENYDSTTHLQAIMDKKNNCPGDIETINFFGDFAIGTCEVVFNSLEPFEFMTPELEREICCIKNNLATTDSYVFYKDIIENNEISLNQLEEEYKKTENRRKRTRNKQSK